MNFRLYTQKQHTGHCPCFMNCDVTQGNGAYAAYWPSDLMTLANCKEILRGSSKLNVGDWIGGGTHVAMGRPTRLSYAMQIGGFWSRKEYWEMYPQTRLDSFYKPNGGSFIRLRNPWHMDDESRQKDLACNRILWSRKFFVFAASFDDDSRIPAGLVLPLRYGKLATSFWSAAGRNFDMADDFIDWLEHQNTVPPEQFRVREPLPEWRGRCASS
jgi:hypothetical protein